MRIRKDPNYRARLKDGQRAEVYLFEPINENYEWQVESLGDCEGTLFLLKDTELNFCANKDKNPWIY